MWGTRPLTTPYITSRAVTNTAPSTIVIQKPIVFLFISANEGRILARKPQPTSRLLQPLKPFEPSVWYFFLGTSVAILITIYIFLFFYQKTLGIEFNGMAWLFIKVVHFYLNNLNANLNQCLYFQTSELMFGHGCINLRIYPKALTYLYAMASIFFLFMLSFFYSVRDPGK